MAQKLPPWYLFNVLQLYYSRGMLPEGKRDELKKKQKQKTDIIIFLLSGAFLFLSGTLIVSKVKNMSKPERN